MPVSIIKLIPIRFVRIRILLSMNKINKYKGGERGDGGGGVGERELVVRRVSSRLT